MEVDDDLLWRIEASLYAMTQYAESYLERIEKEPHPIWKVVQADVQRANQTLRDLEAIYE